MLSRKGIAMVWLVRGLWKLFPSRIALSVLALLAAGQCWMTFGAKPFRLDEGRYEIADEAAGKLAEMLPIPAVGRPTLLVAPIERRPACGR